MPKAIRAFIAVKISPTPPLRKMISQLSRLGRPVKVVDAENLHVTLKFFGDVNPEIIPKIATAMSESSQSVAPISPFIRGLGAFPNPGRPSVIWAGLNEAEPLIQMAGNLQTRLEPLGFSAEARAFQPHLTLARVKSKPPEKLLELLQAHESTEFGSVTIASVELLQSVLGPAGPNYVTLSKTGLLTA